MSVNITLSKAINKTDAEIIRESIIEAMNRLQPKLPISEIDIFVVNQPTVEGFWGNASYEKTIMLINGTKSHLERHRIAPTLFHECHHISRVSAVGYGKNLEETIISEGLAVAMEEEMGETLDLYGKFKDQTELNQVLKLFNAEAKSHKFNHYGWFIDRNAKVLFSGYKLGYLIVKNYCQKTGAKPSVLYKTPASEILAGVSLSDLKL